mmetsp:Transcript_19988/g.61840  ORF Transcript_19988/g.61840 Transcript_19988/m.61840 type:complete len:276 (+) Transcript_19988:337-1164(+)
MRKDATYAEIRSGLLGGADADEVDGGLLARGQADGALARGDDRGVVVVVDVGAVGHGARPENGGRRELFDDVVVVGREGHRGRPENGGRRELVVAVAVALEADGRGVVVVEEVVGPERVRGRTLAEGAAERASDAAREEPGRLLDEAQRRQRPDAVSLRSDDDVAHGLHFLLSVARSVQHFAARHGWEPLRVPSPVLVHRHRSLGHDLPRQPDAHARRDRRIRRRTYRVPSFVNVSEPQLLLLLLRIAHESGAAALSLGDSTRRAAERPQKFLSL